jgi:hypothetical protein
MSDSEHKIWRRKGTVLNASAACSANQVEWVLGGVGWEVFAISAEPSVRSKMSVSKMAIEELSVEDASRDHFQYLPGI